MTFNRASLKFAFSSLAWLLCAVMPASAGDSWRVVQFTGQVTTGAAGLTHVAVQPNQVLPQDGWVQTGESGRAVLVHGRDLIVVGPLSRVRLPSTAVNGNTQVIQSLGSALYQIGKESAPHFQVDTPYLAAVVKGTTFVVAVKDGTASVSVSEGLVQVGTPDNSDMEYVRQGFTAIVNREHLGSVSVVETGSLAMPQTGLDSNAPLAPKPDSNVEEESTHHVIAAAVGDVDLKISDVSDGLATGAVEPSASELKLRNANPSVAVAGVGRGKESEFGERAPGLDADRSPTLRNGGGI